MNRQRSKVLRETTIVNVETGEVKSSVQESIVAKEPDFVKLYLADLVMVNNIPKWVTGILWELLKRMAYGNEIVLNSSIKKRIALELNIVPKTIDNALVTFVKKNILIRKDTGVYLANPYLFGKGDWNSIRKIRLQVEYSSLGKNLEAEIEEEVFSLVE